MLQIHDIKQELLKPNPFLIKVERVESVQPKFLEGSPNLSFYIRIFLDINPFFSGRNALTFSDISFVKYHLHPSYKQSTRISEDFFNNFEIKVWAYGYYRVTASVYPKIGDVRVIQGYVEFPVSAEEKEIKPKDIINQ